MKNKSYFEKLEKAISMLPKEKREELIEYIERAIFTYIMIDIIKMMNKQIKNLMR